MVERQMMIALTKFLARQTLVWKRTEEIQAARRMVQHQSLSCSKFRRASAVTATETVSYGFPDVGGTFPTCCVAIKIMSD